MTLPAGQLKLPARKISAISDQMKKRFCQVQWGAKSMVALYLSLLSGVLVAYQYDPAQPYYSAGSLDILVPFGAFWRSLHFYASQLFFLLSVLHFTAIVIGREAPRVTPAGWVKLTAALMVALLLLFTGYILRGDSTGSSAGSIAENIILAVPLLGKTLNSLLFSLTADGLKRVYANHLVGLGLLWLLLSWDHVRRYQISWRSQTWLVLLTLTFCALIKAPIDPEQIGVFHIAGPWFFIGLQEILRYIPPFWAGIVWPGCLLIPLCLLYPGSRWYRQALWLSACWLLLYALLTLIGLTR